MKEPFTSYYQNLATEDAEICNILHNIIDSALGDHESKIWHGHPVWFIDGNPIVGYDKLKNDVRLLFWSGQSFNEEALIPEGKFKAAELRFKHVNDIDTTLIQRCIEKSKQIQWDYKNIVKRKGELLLLNK